jgi:hypothetical protein
MEAQEDFACIPSAKVTKLKHRPTVKIVSVRLSVDIYLIRNYLILITFGIVIHNKIYSVFKHICLIYLPRLKYVKLKSVFIDFIKKVNCKNFLFVA